MNVKSGRGSSTTIAEQTARLESGGQSREAQPDDDDLLTAGHEGNSPWRLHNCTVVKTLPTT
jgi:hypothetical protein